MRRVLLVEDSASMRAFVPFTAEALVKHALEQLGAEPASGAHA
jgi:hypothetical protein